MTGSIRGDVEKFFNIQSSVTHLAHDIIIDDNMFENNDNCNFIKQFIINL